MPGMISKRLTRTMYQTSSALLVCDATNLTAMHYVFYMGQQENGDYMCLNPLGLMPSSSELIKILNEWQEFRVKTITLEWLPSVKGNPRRVETGGTVSDNASYKSYLCYTVMPTHSPARYNQATGTIAANSTLCDFDFFNGAMTNTMLDQQQNPKPRIHQMNNHWKMTWKAMIPSAERWQYSSPNLTTGPAWGTDYLQTLQNGKWRPMPWMPLVNSGGDSTSSIAITGLMGWLRQPYMAFRDDKTFAWLDGSTMIGNGMYGRWRLSSTWEFRKRRSSVAQIFVDYNTTTGVLTVNSPSVHPPVTAMSSI